MTGHDNDNDEEDDDQGQSSDNSSNDSRVVDRGQESQLSIIKNRALSSFRMKQAQLVLNRGISEASTQGRVEIRMRKRRVRKHFVGAFFKTLFVSKSADSTVDKRDHVYQSSSDDNGSSNLDKEESKGNTKEEDERSGDT